jgi:tRNA(adenine34) deaminase
VVDAQGVVLARGRNRLGEEKYVEGVISGHRLGHAEVNALLTLPELSAEECRTLTLYTTVEPCPMCLGAMLMARIGQLAYAAADPWARHTEALTATFYPSQKNVQINRAPDALQHACTLLLLVSFLDGPMPRDHGFFASFREHHPAHLDAALKLHDSGALVALRAHEATLDEALPVLMDVPA